MTDSKKSSLKSAVNFKFLSYIFKYISWMFRGRYIRFVKILYTSFLVTALFTMQIERFLELAFAGFVGREILLILFKPDYREKSLLLRLSGD